MAWSWIASRMFLAVLMFFSLWAWWREQRLGEAGKIDERLVYGAVVALAALSFAFFVEEVFALLAPYRDGHGLECRQ